MIGQVSARWPPKKRDTLTGAISEDNNWKLFFLDNFMWLLMNLWDMNTCMSDTLPTGNRPTKTEHNTIHRHSSHQTYGFTLRLRQNGRHFADHNFKCIFFNKNFWIPIKISLKFVPKGLINNIPSLVQIMVWRRLGAKPLSEPMRVSLLTHICVTRPQWVKDHWDIVNLEINSSKICETLW